jgi:hypothetical protein
VTLNETVLPHTELRLVFTPKIELEFCVKEMGADWFNRLAMAALTVMRGVKW